MFCLTCSTLDFYWNIQEQKHSIAFNPYKAEVCQDNVCSFTVLATCLEDTTVLYVK